MPVNLILQALELEKEAKEVKDEFQEFQEGSRELEAELETQLEQVTFMINLLSIGLCCDIYPWGMP